MFTPRKQDCLQNFCDISRKRKINNFTQRTQQKIQVREKSKVKAVPSTSTPKIQQKVQILRTPDGKLQVRGLMSGRQLVQTPDGKFHIRNTP